MAVESRKRFVTIYEKIRQPIKYEHPVMDMNFTRHGQRVLILGADPLNKSWEFV